MNIENSSGHAGMDEEPVEEYFNGLEHSILKKSKIGLRFPGITEIPLVIAGAGLLVLIVFLSIFIFTVFVQKPEKVDNEGKFEGKFRSVDARLNQLEGRLVKMETIAQQLLKMENRGKQIGAVVVRINQLESDFSSQLNLVSQQLDQHVKQQEEEKKKQASPLPSPPEKSAEVSTKKNTEIYHHVHSGETLYRISLKYGVTPAELRQLNPSVSGNTIYKGQKIRVK